MIKAILIFILAGLCEIGGGYLIWLWLKEDKPIVYGMAGGIVLILYGVVATLQPAGFGRVYAAYGGIFIGLSVLWAWWIDGFKPDRYDLLGALLALIGAGIIFFAPRH
ncbi:small multidrug resistance family-3 protein [Larkinella arboricola]|uniref:Small multidrug resistance family-3 protein n=1 Tax=Larkinella arboricola TaxID=643671 RepID=A0A327X0Z1_LARAB|nr:YnfA family protein [Larkinella arboricola]RAJ99997.1 small multidrug resistance family-3 protein [Larkinella arboricola]